MFVPDHGRYRAPASAELENIDEYSRLHRLMQQVQGSTSQVGEWALTNNQNFPFVGGATAIAVIADGAARTDADGVSSNADRAVKGGQIQLQQGRQERL